MGLMYTKLTAVSLTEPVLNTLVLLFVCLFLRFSLSTLSKRELFIKGLLHALFIQQTLIDRATMSQVLFWELGVNQ